MNRWPQNQIYRGNKLQGEIYRLQTSKIYVEKRQTFFTFCMSASPCMSNTENGNYIHKWAYCVHQSMTHFERTCHSDWSVYKYWRIKETKNCCNLTCFEQVGLKLCQSSDAQRYVFLLIDHMLATADIFCHMPGTYSCTSVAVATAAVEALVLIFKYCINKICYKMEFGTKSLSTFSKVPVKIHS